MNESIHNHNHASHKPEKKSWKDTAKGTIGWIAVGACLLVTAKHCSATYNADRKATSGPACTIKINESGTVSGTISEVLPNKYNLNMVVDHVLHDIPENKGVDPGHSRVNQTLYVPIAVCEGAEEEGVATEWLPIMDDNGNIIVHYEDDTSINNPSGT